MATPEKKVKDKIKKYLNELGCYYAMPATGGYGSSGVPDFLVCYKGKFVGIEAKANGNRPTALQLRHLENIEASKGYSYIIDDTNVDELPKLLKGIK